MSMNVKCPVCKKVWTVKQGTTDVECDCHLYCPHGTLLSDCSVTPVTWTGQLKWPRGVHRTSMAEHDERPSHNYYCITHDYYYDKIPVLIDVDWSQVNRRAKSDMRDFGEGTV